MRHSHKSTWIAKFENERDYFSADPNTFEDWSRCSKPESRANWQLSCGLWAIYADAAQATSQKFLRAAIEIVDRAVAEDKFRSKDAEMAFPENRGNALRVRAYSDAVMAGSFDASDLISAGRDIETYWARLGPEDWDSQIQAYFLGIVRMALIAGDLGRAREVLDTKRSFKWHSEEHKLLRRVVDETLFGMPIRDEELLTQITSFFDRIRNPEFKPDVLMELDEARLEWGAIIIKYFETGSSIDWNRVVKLVSQ